MSLLKSLASLVNVLETYRGRDRFIRLTTYAAMFMGGDGKTPAQIKWGNVATEMGACRVILRLFDDLPMLLLNLSTKFGFKEKGVTKWLGLLGSVLNQAFYPLEHIAWLRQKKIQEGAPLPFLLLGLIVWGLSLLTTIIKSVIEMRMLNVQAQQLRKQRELDRDGSGYSSSQNALIKENLKKLAAERKDLFLLLIQSCADFTNAISWMPPGILWSQKLSRSVNGIMGLIATFIMLYRNWPSSFPSQ